MGGAPKREITWMLHQLRPEARNVDVSSASQERIECPGMHPENLAPHRRRDINCPVRTKLQDPPLTGTARQAVMDPIHPVSNVLTPRTLQSQSLTALREQRPST